MQKINTPDQLFHDGDPSTGALGSIVTADWLNTMQGELVSVIEAAGIKLDAARTDQLQLAISKMISSAGMLTAASRVVRSAAELDAIRANGFYTAFNTNADGHVLHLQHSGSAGYAVQIMFGQWGRVPTTAGSGLCWRALINGAWGDWQRLFHSGNLDLATLATTAGSLQLQPALGDKVDLNTIKETGLYHQPLDAYVKTGSNWPSVYAGVLMVYSAAQMVYQRYQTYRGSYFLRCCYNGNWSDWQHILLESDLPSVWDSRLAQRMTFQY